MDHPFIFFSLCICFERVLKSDSWRESSIETDSYWLAPPGKKPYEPKNQFLLQLIYAFILLFVLEGLEGN